MLVKILGTVSPHCHGKKNCPGFLIQENSSKVLLDCGNGITRELNKEQDLKDLTIVISHLHKDHYGDLLSLAYTSYIHHNLGLLDKKIKVYIPKPNYQNEILTFSTKRGEKISKNAEPTIFDYIFLTNLGKEQYLEFVTYDETTILNIGDLELTFAKNPHQVNTYATKVTTPSASIIYSSDTGYQCNSIEDFAKNSDLLICESTYFKGQQRKEDNHLYAYEAGLIASKVNTSMLLLTHFYPELPKEKYLEEAKEIFSATEVAEEGKILRLERRENNDRPTYS